MSRGDTDTSLVKLSPNGQLLWVEQIGGTDQDRAIGLNSTKGGSPIVNVLSFGEVTLGSGANTTAVQFP